MGATKKAGSEYLCLNSLWGHSLKYAAFHRLLHLKRAMALVLSLVPKTVYITLAEGATEGWDQAILSKNSLRGIF